MSTHANGKHILCDGADCEKIASVPIALNPMLGGANDGKFAPYGWLFITGSGLIRHYCPLCAQEQLEGFTAANPFCED